VELGQNHSTPIQRTFISLMDLYEQNYIRLRQLIPELDEIETNAISVRRNGIDLHLEIIERGKYTTTLLLTHRFHNPKKNKDTPNLLVRLQFDTAKRGLARATVRRDFQQTLFAKIG